MADDGSKQSETVWPLPKFCFEVNFGDGVVLFQEVTGLDVEAHPIGYRHGDSPSFSVVKMPGIAKYGNVTLRKGVFPEGRAFWAWFNASKMNTIERRTVTISLVDEAGRPTMVWTLANAWPAKISGTDLKSSGTEVAVESVELAHEGLTIANA